MARAKNAVWLQHTPNLTKGLNRIWEILDDTMHKDSIKRLIFIGKLSDITLLKANVRNAYRLCMITRELDLPVY